MTQHWQPQLAIRIPRSRFAFNCYWCGVLFRAGVRAWWYRLDKLMSCDECHRDTR
jgi:hypothetical protein